MDGGEELMNVQRLGSVQGKTHVLGVDRGIRVVIAAAEEGSHSFDERLQIQRAADTSKSHSAAFCRREEDARREVEKIDQVLFEPDSVLRKENTIQYLHLWMNCTSTQSHTHTHTHTHTYTHTNTHTHTQTHTHKHTHTHTHTHTYA